MALPKASQEEIQRAAREIGQVLVRYFQWHQQLPTKIPQVNTNIGTFLFYGLTRPQQASDQSIDGSYVTTYEPYSKTLMASSTLPTTEQKVILLEAILNQVGRQMGMPGEAISQRMDPTRDESVIDLAGSRLLEIPTAGDPYKTITKPFVVSLTWLTADELHS